MKDQLKRFVLLIPERYTFDAEECAEYMLLRSRSLTNAEFVRVQRQRTCLDKAVELCNILVDKCASFNNGTKPPVLLRFVEAIEHVLLNHNNNHYNNNTLANDLRREIAMTNETVLKANRIRFYGDFPAPPKAFYHRNEEKNLREALQRLCKKQKQGGLIVFGPKGAGKETLVGHLMSDEPYLLTSCGVDTVIWLRCGSFISPTTRLFDRDVFYAELLAGLLQVELDASNYSSLNNNNSDAIYERLKDAAASRNSPALIVLDGASNATVIELTLQIGSMMRCVAITHDKSKLLFDSADDWPVIEEVAVDKLTGDDIRNMFATCCPLPKSGLTDFQVKTLIDCSDGLPLLASLISANFHDCHDKNEVGARFEHLTLQFQYRINVEDMLSSAIEGERLQRNAVELIRASLLLVAARRRYEAFLLFNPQQPVEADDMAVIWNCSPQEAAEICANQRRHHLLLGVNNVDNSGSKITRKFCLHWLLHSTTFDLISERHGSLQLNELRSSLVDRPHNSESLSVDGENLLHRAIKQQRRLVLETVLKNVEPSTTLPKLCGEPTGDSRQTPLHYLYACQWRFSTGTYNETNYSLYIFCQFVDKLAQLNKQDTLSVMNLEDENGASLVGLIKSDVEKCQQQRTEDNVLFMAARCGYVSLVDLLLSCYVNVNDAFNESGDPALLIATHNGHVGVVELLIRSGVDVNTRSRAGGYTALMIAALRYDRELTQLFFDWEADLNARNENGDTALILAATHGDAEFIFSFLQKGANVNAKNYNGESVLLQVARNSAIKGSCDMAWELLDCGADVNTCNEYGHTPLMLAAISGHVEMARLLLQQKAINVNLCNIDQLTALMITCRAGHGEIVRLILDYLDQNESNGNNVVRKQAVIDAQHIQTGETPLMMASEKGHGQIVKMLLDAGVNVDVKNQAGETALDKATKQANTEIVKLFLEHAANKSVISSYLPGCTLQ